MSSQQSNQRGQGQRGAQGYRRGGAPGAQYAAGAQRGGFGDRGGQGGYGRGRGDGQRGRFDGQSGGRSRTQSGGDSRPGTSSDYSRDDSNRGRGFSRGRGRGRGGQRGGRARSASPVRNDVRDIAQTIDIKEEFKDKKHGTLGRRVELISNHYPLNPINREDDINAYQYDIEITRRRNETKKGKPQVMSPIKENYDNNKRIVEKMAVEWKVNDERVLQPKKYGFDGNKILYSYIKLNIGSEQITRVVNINLDGYERTYDVKIQFARDVPIESLNNLDTFEEFTEGHTILDIALKDRDLTKENLVSVGRHLFDLNDRQELRDKNCSLVFGHHKSIHPSECGPTVNVDRVTTAFRAVENEPLIEYLCREIEIRNRSNFGLHQLLGFQFTEDVIRFINNKIKNLRIYSNHIVINGRPQKRSHIIEKMIDKKPNQHSFQDDSGQMITLEVYFRGKYGKVFQYRNIPLIKIKGGTPENPKLLPAELCYVSPQKMSREMLANNPGIQSDIVEASNSQSPLKRFEKIQSSVETISNESQELMANSGYKIDPTPIKLDGRELPVPEFKYKPNNRRKDNYYLYDTVALNHSVFLNLSERVRPQLSQCFDQFFNQETHGMIDSAGRIGFTVRLPIIWNTYKPEYNYDLSTTQRQVKAFENFIETFNKERLKPNSVFSNTQLIFVSLSYINDVYNTVKHCSENQRENKTGILTQCILDDSFIRPPKGYFYNFLRKTNAKLNGQNQVLESGYRPKIFSQRRTMVVGADVTHSGYHNPQAGERVRTSIAGVVGSYDMNFSKYAAIVSGQTPNVEIIRDFDVIIGKLMKHFKSFHKSYPSIIVLFRDGVSESQLETVMNAEVQLIYKAYQTLEAGFKPKIVALVVQKRHHTRLILSKPEINQKGNELFNPRSGTVVDHTITNAYLDEFILYSQKGMLGTSRPANYVELINEIELSADDCQKFAYSMCFTYHRCSTPISIPIPVKYADDAAYRAKRHLDVQNMRYEAINPNETEEQKAIREENLLRDIDQNIKVNNNIVILPYYC